MHFVFLFSLFWMTKWFRWNRKFVWWWYPSSTLCFMGKANSDELVALILQRGKFSILIALNDNWNHISYYFSESGKKFQICSIYFLVKGLTVSFFQEIWGSQHNVKFSWKKWSNLWNILVSLISMISVQFSFALY